MRKGNIVRQRIPLMRIVSLAPSNTEILFALGAEKEIIARTAFCDYPEAAKGIKKTVDSSDIEEIRKLDADLILTSTMQDKLANELEESGLPVAHLSPHSLKGIFNAINEIGDLTGKTDEAIKLVGWMSSELEKIKSTPVEKKRLYIECWDDPPMVSGDWVPEIAEIAGAHYPLKAGRPSREMSAEEIQEYDPEIIILSICGKKVDKDIVQKRAGWENLSAVKNKKVHVMDDSLLNRPGPRVVQACAILNQLIIF